MPFQIIRNDITKVKADIIVNSANPKPVYASGTDGAIYKAAGADQLLAERRKIGAIKCGDAAVTPAFNLKAKYIIHTVAPAWHGGDKGEFEALKSCYKRSLEKAYELGCESIAFPLLATGVYGFPKTDALRIAMDEIGSFLMRDNVDMTVKLVVFDDKSFRLSRNLFFQVESFIDDEAVIAAHKEEYGLNSRAFERERAGFRIELGDFDTPLYPILKPTGAGPFNEHTFDKKLYMNDGKDDCSFQEHLLKLIIEKDMDNAKVYKSSNVTKGAFSKIMCGDTKKPQKKTVLGFCIGLRLNMEEAEGLLASADMAFNPYNKRDRLVIQCIRCGQYDIDEINVMLFICGQPLLGN
jgi:O-acetyl-ADP-ribose deacetylase (regulator of RNase III)